MNLFLDSEGFDENSKYAKFLEENWESLEDFGVKDSLKKCVGKWEEVTQDKFLLGVIKEGYHPPFSSIPKSKFMRNNRSAATHSEFVIQSVSELLKNGAAKLVSKPPLVVNPITVSVQNNGKKRLICDLRYVNSFLAKQKFKLDDLKTALPSFRKDSFAFTFDLKKSYYHVNLHPDVVQYFGFSFEYKGERLYGVYTVGPFGLASMPWLWTKLLKPWVARWRKMGLICYLYLDDGVGVAPSKREAQLFSDWVRNDLHEAGLKEQPVKCLWEAVQVFVWLGLEIDLENYEISVPKEKLQKALGALEGAMRAGECSPRKLLRAAGVINSLSLVLGRETLLRTKALYREIRDLALGTSRGGWDSRVSLSREARECLLFWRENLPTMRTRRSLSCRPVSAVIFSDASSTGGASVIKRLDEDEKEENRKKEGVLDHKSDNNTAICQWTEEEKGKSST